MSSIQVCSLPIKTSVGYHLVWISDVRPGGKPNLVDHWPEVEKMALNQKKSVWFQEWLEQARSRLFISIREKY
jgi:parvulin-like peptidyl-prolyl isomerase